MKTFFEIFYDTRRFEPLLNFVNEGLKVNFQPLFHPYYTKLIIIMDTV